MKNEDLITVAESSEDNDVYEKLENTFLSVVIHWTDEIFDYLSLDELAALNSTCRKLQQLTADYVHRKFPMKFMKVDDHLYTNKIQYRCRDKSMQPFTQNVRSLVVMPSTSCLEYLRSQHTKELVSISFYDGEILASDTNAIAVLIENVEIIEFQYVSMAGEFYEFVLKFCRHIKQLVIKYGFNECERTGIENQWLLKTYPSLEHFHWSAGPLPENLDQFFRLNPKVRSFNGSTYTSQYTVEFLLNTNISIDELHFQLYLELLEDKNDSMAMLRASLNTLYERKQIKSLILQFTFCSELLDEGWASLPYLHGAHVDFPERPGSTKALSSLVHLKLLVLGINTKLSRAKASILARNLLNLEEIYIQINSIHAITPFIRYAMKINRIYVYKMGSDEAVCGKIKRNFFRNLNKERMNHLAACKTTIYLPDQAYVAIKRKSPELNLNLIQVKRSESQVLTHPFVTTVLRREICEMYERF